uniref:HAT C-terminal dimerisation domain-containing protein n=1 Tax=Oryzias sinensis TaxID=183150 RepID=A0A8C8DXT2_9TELE
MAKRKKIDEYCTFQQDWTEEFAFVERASSAVCLICNDKIASMKRSNIKRHFDTRDAAFASKYPAGESRKKACQELLSRVAASQQLLRVWTQQGDGNSASFAAALVIVRNGKPFTDGEFAKSFMLDVANELYDDFSDKDRIVKRIKDMPLSARTVHNRTIMMLNQLEAAQVKNTAQRDQFIQFNMIARYVVGDTLREESLAVLPLKGTTRGEDLFKSFNEFAIEKNLPMDKLFSMFTDGAPCMVGKNRGFIAPLSEHEKRRILSFHCILHQEMLCMSLVIRVVNFIVARALNDRQFKALLDEVGNSYPGLLLHSNVRWLSRGKVLSHFELADTEWLLKFYYLVDMTGHLNQLNVKMQGFGNTILSLQQAVFAFENDIETGRLLHFEKLAEFKDACIASDPVRHLHLQQLDLSYIPERLERQQAELASQHKWEEMKKLQPADQLILKTWNTLPDTFFTLQRVSVAVLTMFGSTYACEQSFSHLKNIKTNLRSCLTDGSLNACMKLNLTLYQPDYKTISKKMQHQKSH